MEVPAGGSKRKPVTKGKEDIQCYYCDKTIRKDTLTRHTDNWHKGKVPRSKHVTIGVDDLSKFGFCSEKVKPGGNINTVNLADEGKIDSDEFGETDYTKDCIDLSNNFRDIDKDIVKPIHNKRQCNEGMKQPKKNKIK